MNKFCSRPFEWIEIHPGRKTHLCCPAWLKSKPIDISGKSVKDVWNDPLAQELSMSILDGSFRYCDVNECPFLSQKDIAHWERNGSPVKDIGEVKDARFKQIIKDRRTKLDDGPFIWNCCHDKTCNLSCPSCRKTVLALNAQEVQKELDFQRRILEEIGDHLSILYVTGTGDPFASEVFRKLLGGLSATRYPNLGIHLHSNGLLWTPKNWNLMSGINQKITSAHISIDAASP